jgi:hypothetical protein
MFLIKEYKAKKDTKWQVWCLFAYIRMIYFTISKSSTVNISVEKGGILPCSLSA